MAAACSLLSRGRVATLKTLQLEAWGLRSVSPSLSLCTKSEGSKRGPKNNVVAPQESTKLLATKTAVEFPKKLFPSSHPPSGNKGETKTTASTSPDEALKLTDEDVRKFLSRKTLVAFPERVTLSSLEGKASITTRGGLSKKLAEEESSSSSESDSSSDSDEESASEVAIKTRVEFPRQEPFFFETRTAKVMTSPEESLSQKRDREYIPKKKPYRPEIETPHIKQMKSGKTATDNSKILKLETKEPAMKHSPKETNLQRSVSKTQIEESQKLTEVKLKESRHLAETSIGAAAAQLKVPPLPHQDMEHKLTLLRWEETKTREVQETEVQERNTPKLQEEFLKDTTLMVNTTTEEEMLQETGAQTEEQAAIQETKTAAASSQEEFDNSTYRNLQHHEYNMYTFVDFDVELSKFRQPQPSSGRLSSRY
ncbi:NADH dehydrogenase [ubiquinone] flavoprotein 3, mitochondrial isoform X2 [Emydura macquarii macquarii]|uniref:NADH dehydrogenase [ubiquinone] flavoprotein 3, mitochondrial isoform X2 n=1 Tax=Emydura macquarii macquarii TaxID=1129001 RepID=UPI003529D97E